MKIYYYIVSGGELREVVLGVYGGKGAGRKFRHAAYVATRFTCTADEAERPKTCFTWPAVAEQLISGNENMLLYSFLRRAAGGCVKKSRASSEMSRKSAGIPGVAVMPLVKKSRASSEMSRKSPPGRKFRHAAYVATTVNMYRGEAERPKTCFTWPVWRSN